MTASVHISAVAPMSIVRIVSTVYGTSTDPVSDTLARSFEDSEPVRNGDSRKVQWAVVPATPATHQRPSARPRRTRLWALTALLAVGVLALAACGSSNGGSANPTAMPSQPTPGYAPASDMPVNQQRDYVDVARTFIDHARAGECHDAWNMMTTSAKARVKSGTDEDSATAYDSFCADYLPCLARIDLDAMPFAIVNADSSHGNRLTIWLTERRGDITVSENTTKRPRIHGIDANLGWSDDNCGWDQPRSSRSW